jgi:ribosomal protein S3
MGQKTHPYGFRLGVIKTWNSKWFEDKNYAKWLHEDIRIRRAVKEYLMNANIAGVEVERAANKAKVIVFTARPGMVIGKGGKGIETLKSGNIGTAAKGETLFPGVQSFTDNEVFIDVQEVRKAETSAQLVAENIATQLERRVAFRRASNGDEIRRQRHPRSLLGSPRRRRDVARRDLPRGARSAPHASRRHRVRHGRSAHEVWNHRREGLDLQR